MIAKNPEIAQLRSWCERNSRDDLVIRILDLSQDHIYFAGREADESEIDINIDRCEFAEL